MSAQLAADIEQAVPVVHMQTEDDMWAFLDRLPEA